jgi:hypothetical protein
MGWSGDIFTLSYKIKEAEISDSSALDDCLLLGPISRLKVGLIMSYQFDNIAAPMEATR